MLQQQFEKDHSSQPLPSSNVQLDFMGCKQTAGRFGVRSIDDCETERYDFTVDR